MFTLLLGFIQTKIEIIPKGDIGTIRMRREAYCKRLTWLEPSSLCQGFDELVADGVSLGSPVSILQ